MIDLNNLIKESNFNSYGKSDYALFQGDCLEVMENIKDKSIDLMVTDPPYLHIKGGSKCKRVNRGIYNEKSNIKSNMSDFGENEIYMFLNSMKLKMKKMNAYIFASKLQVVYYLKWANENKYQYDILIWDKCKSGLIGHKAFATNIEYIIRIYQYGCGLNAIKENDKLISLYYQKIQRIKPVKNKIHEAEKPVELLQRIIKLSSNENDIVLDPFMGSGSTGVACLNTNRKFIGIELDENYFNIAKDRIKNN